MLAILIRLYVKMIIYFRTDHFYKCKEKNHFYKGTIHSLCAEEMSITFRWVPCGKYFSPN